jgi:hypothetical protein
MELKWYERSRHMTIAIKCFYRCLSR